jgi:glycerophosphoryl diester phosphodiesterase
MNSGDGTLGGHPFVVAHRGASAERPEHTLAAYELALAEGADGVECDVRLTRDGHLVCVHDRRVDRTSRRHRTDQRDDPGADARARLPGMASSWRGQHHGDTGLLALDDLVSLVLDWNRPSRLFIKPSIPSATARWSSKVLALLLGMASRHRRQRICRARW